MPAKDPPVHAAEVRYNDDLAVQYAKLKEELRCQQELCEQHTSEVERLKKTNEQLTTVVSEFEGGTERLLALQAQHSQSIAEPVVIAEETAQPHNSVPQSSLPQDIETPKSSTTSTTTAHKAISPNHKASPPVQPIFSDDNDDLSPVSHSPSSPSQQSAVDLILSRQASSKQQRRPPPKRKSKDALASSIFEAPPTTKSKEDIFEKMFSAPEATASSAPPPAGPTDPSKSPAVAPNSSVPSQIQPKIQPKTQPQAPPQPSVEEGSLQTAVLKTENRNLKTQLKITEEALHVLREQLAAIQQMTAAHVQSLGENKTDSEAVKEPPPSSAEDIFGEAEEEKVLPAEVEVEEAGESDDVKVRSMLFTWITIALKYDAMMVGGYTNINLNSFALYEKVLMADIAFPEWPAYVRAQIYAVASEPN